MCSTTNPNSVPPNLQIQNGEWTSRGIELEAVANPTPGLKLIGAFTSYDLFVSKDANPALIGKVPTATPPHTDLGSGLTTPSRSGPLTGFGLGGGVRLYRRLLCRRYQHDARPLRRARRRHRPLRMAELARALNVINVADTIYVANCSSANACFYGDRRRATASLSYKW